MGHLDFAQAESLVKQFADMKLAEYTARFGKGTNVHAPVCGYYEALLARVMAGEIDGETLARHLRRWLADAATPIDCSTCKRYDASSSECPPRCECGPDGEYPDWQPRAGKGE
ncbi:MAG TPA: hypothetical protein DEB56_14770 [Thiobacillus sp.]|nr:hypothetical protein [Thiobacillus sp.]